nr:MAG TPA: hypothetical protein [Caudoviricetes sp.]
MITPYDNIRIIASEKRPYFSFYARSIEMSAYFIKDCYLHEIIDMIYGQKRFCTFVRPHKIVKRR